MSLTIWNSNILIWIYILLFFTDDFRQKSFDIWLNFRNDDFLVIKFYHKCKNVNILFEFTMENNNKKASNYTFQLSVYVVIFDNTTYHFSTTFNFTCSFCWWIDHWFQSEEDTAHKIRFVQENIFLKSKRDVSLISKHAIYLKNWLIRQRVMIKLLECNFRNISILENKLISAQLFQNWFKEDLQL